MQLQDNLDRAIEAVVNAEDTIIKMKKKKDETTEKSVNQQKIEALDKQINETVNNIMSRTVVEEEKCEQEKVDEIIVIDDDVLEESEVMGTFGPFGEPFYNRFLCPLCANFKTKNAVMIRGHLYEELQYYR